MNTTFKKLIKKNPEIQSIDRFGITRCNKTWVIRLGWQNKTPRFKQTILDSDYGGAIASLIKAAEIVRENRNKYRSTFQPETNYVKGLVLTRHKNRSGKTYFWRWQVAYRKNGSPTNKTFSFWKTGKIYESYLKSVRFSLDIGVQVDLDQIDKYFTQYIQKVENEFFERSDIKAFNSDPHRTLLKIRHLQWKAKSRMVRPYS